MFVECLKGFRLESAATAEHISLLVTHHNPLDHNPYKDTYLSLVFLASVMITKAVRTKSLPSDMGFGKAFLLLPLPS